MSEWSFKKDGVDAAMKDLANETRGAQTDDRDTFLGIGQKRYIRVSNICNHLAFYLLTGSKAKGILVKLLGSSLQLRGQTSKCNNTAVPGLLPCMFWN